MKWRGQIFSEKDRLIQSMMSMFMFPKVSVILSAVGETGLISEYASQTDLPGQGVREMDAVRMAARGATNFDSDWICAWGWFFRTMRYPVLCFLRLRLRRLRYRLTRSSGYAIGLLERVGRGSRRLRVNEDGSGMRSWLPDGSGVVTPGDPEATVSLKGQRQSTWAAIAALGSLIYIVFPAAIVGRSRGVPSGDRNRFRVARRVYRPMGLLPLSRR